MKKKSVKDFYFKELLHLNLVASVSLVSFIWLTDVGGVQEGGLTDVAIEVLHRLLSHVIHGPRDQVGVGDDQVSAFMETLKKGFCLKLLFVHVCTMHIFKQEFKWLLTNCLPEQSHLVVGYFQFMLQKPRNVLHPGDMWHIFSPTSVIFLGQIL